ncbi:MAG TPA: hypothetical protein VIV55_10035 [Flavobacterium sp.]
MALKNKFPKKIADTKAMATVSSSTAVEEPIQEMVNDTPTTPKAQEQMIPKSEIDAYVRQQVEESMKNLQPSFQPQKQEIPSKKVEPSDELPEFENWEVKDRIYVLCTGHSSLSQGIKDRHKKNSPLMYKGRALRYSPSQASFFMDKQSGDVLLQYLFIEEGRMFVSKENTHLQKFLAIHPENGIIFKEFNPTEESKIAYDAQQLKLDAHWLSRNIDTTTLVSVAMLMCKNYTENMDMFTVKRDLYNEIEANPKLFIKLASDKSLKLKTIGKMAVNRGLLRFENYRFLDESGAVICESSRNENEYDSLASFFASSEGRSLYEYLMHKIEG